MQRSLWLLRIHKAFDGFPGGERVLNDAERALIAADIKCRFYDPVRHQISPQTLSILGGLGKVTFTIAVNFVEGLPCALYPFFQVRGEAPVKVCFQHKTRREIRVTFQHDPAGEVQRGKLRKGNAWTMLNVGADLPQYRFKRIHLTRLDARDDAQCVLCHDFLLDTLFTAI